jgi:tetratricopeptide (TPR) repeat protein
MDCRKCLWLALGIFFVSTGCQNTKTPNGTATVQGESRPVLPAVAPYHARKPNEDDNLPKTQPRPALLVAAGDLFLREALAPEATQEKKMENFDKARINYQQAIRNEPTYLPAQMGLARTYVGMNQLEQARDVYETILHLSPKNGVAYSDMAVVYLRSKNGDAAIKCLQKAVELEPENRQHQNTLAWTLARLGRNDESLAVFTKLHGEAGAHVRMAKMHQHLKQVEPARRHLEAALAVDPDLVEARNLLTSLSDGAPQPGTPPVQVQVPQPASPIRPAIYNQPSTPATVDPVGAEEPQVSKPEAPPNYVVPAELIVVQPASAEPEDPEPREPERLLPPPPPTR